MLLYIWCCILWCSYTFVSSFTIVAEGGPATERTTDLTLRCDVTDLVSDDELLRITWLNYDQQLQTFVELFSADLTSDVPSYYFSEGWSGRAVYESTGIGNIILPARYVTKEIAGEYRCQVNSLLTSGMANLKIDVFYGPGTSIMTSPGGRVEQQEGDALTLTCAAQCNPPCLYRWYKAGKKISDDAALEMTSVTTSDAGLYACQARNDAGRSIKPVDLRVFCQASIVRMNITGVRDDPGPPHVQDVVDHSQGVMLNCEVTGWPEPSVEWLSDGQPVAETNATVVTQVDVDRRLNLFEVRPATCLRNGEYTCKAFNGVGEPSTQTTVLNLACSPFETNFSEKCQVGSEVNQVITLNDHVEFDLCFYGNPEPVVTIATETGSIGEEHVYSPKVYCDQTKRNCEARLHLNLTLPNQYGIYLVRISNSQGYLLKRYNITSQQPPTSPSFFRVVNLTHNSSCLSWDEQYNGGSKQKYSLSYRQRVHPDEHGQEDDKYTVIVVDEDEAASDKRQPHVTCLHGLMPKLEYEVVLTASNKYGRSRISRYVVFTTLASIPTDGPSQPWINIDQQQFIKEGERPSNQSPFPNSVNARLILRPVVTRHNKSFSVTETTTTKSPVNVKHWLRGSRDKTEDKEVEPRDEIDDMDDDDFFQLFDSFFIMDSLTDLNSSIKPKAFANFSAHIRKLVNSYTRGQLNGSRHDSFNKLSLPVLPGQTTMALPGSDKSSDTTSFLISVIGSVSSVTIVFVLAGVVILTCRSVFKKRRRLKECQERHIKRMKGCAGQGERPEIVIVDARPMQAQGCVTSEATSLVNEESECLKGNTLRSSSSSRPRLATPNFNLRTTLLKPAKTGDDGYSMTDSVVCCPQVKTAANRCYVDLSVSSGDTQPEGGNTAEVVMTPACLDMISLSRVDTITPPSSWYSSNNDETSVKQLSDSEYSDSTNYLQLYEALTVKPRSRSPSNIYDPLRFDVLQIKTITHKSPSLGGQRFQSDEIVQRRLLRHARMTQQARDHHGSPKSFSTHVRSVVKCWERKMSDPQRSTDKGNTLSASPVRSRNYTLVTGTSDVRMSVSDGYLKPRDFSYVNTHPLVESLSSKSYVPSRTADTDLNKDELSSRTGDTATLSDDKSSLTDAALLDKDDSLPRKIDGPPQNNDHKGDAMPIPKKRRTTNVKKQMSHSQRSSKSANSQVYHINRRLMLVNDASDERVSHSDDSIKFTRESQYVDIDRCLLCRPYIEMRANLSTRKQVDVSSFIDITACPVDNSSKHSSNISDFQMEPEIRPLSAEYLIPFVNFTNKVIAPKRRNTKSLKEKQSSENQPHIPTEHFACAADSSDDNGKNSKKNDVKAYMITDCVNVVFPEDVIVFGLHSESLPDLTNIYDEVIIPTSHHLAHDC